MTKVSVLVADDHEPTRRNVVTVIDNDPRLRVCADVGDAAAAIEAAERERPDVCVLDLRMPGGGVSATREIAARVPTTKIVMFTVVEEDANLLGAIRAGAIGYLPKSMDIRKLPDAIVDAAQGVAVLPRRMTSTIFDELREPVAARRRVFGSASSDLTSREWEILNFVAQGLTDAQIAKRLVISKSTVRWFVHMIVRKLGLPDREALRREFSGRHAS